MITTILMASLLTSPMEMAHSPLENIIEVYRESGGYYTPNVPCTLEGTYFDECPLAPVQDRYDWIHEDS